MATRVLVGLGGQSGQEVELDSPPSLAEGGPDGGEEILLCDQLVDDLAHAPRSGFGREREPAAPRLLDLRGDAHGEGVDAQARQADADVAAAERVVHGAAHDLLDAAEVGGREAGQGDLVVARAAQPVVHHVANLLGWSLADGAGDHAGLAETATAGAAAEDLDVEPIVDDLGERHELALGIGPRGQVADRALLYDLRHASLEGLDRGDAPVVEVAHVVEAGHVDARDPCQLPQHVAAALLGPPPGLPRGDHLGDLADHLLAVAQHDEVEEVGEGLGVVGAVASGADQRVGAGPASCVQRDAGQVEAVQDVRVDELCRKVEGDDVELVG